ncbi:MAG: cytochrome c biogenesis protein CcsA [Rikenellaceae bacterium]
MAKKISFYLYSLITMIMMSATIVEKYKGTLFVQSQIYGSWWFMLVWAVMTIFAIVYTVRSKLHKQLATFMIHVSFVIMMLGALATHTTSEQGTIYLTTGEAQSYYINNDNQKIKLPFSITLDNFEIEYYSGTNAAADYISHITFKSDNKEQLKSRVSMNNIATLDGYRFYQSDYDRYGSILSVNRDIYGITITYIGYLLLFISLILTLTLNSGTLVRLLRSTIISKGAIVLAFAIITTNSAAASTQKTTPETLSNQQIELLNELQVVYNDRVMPLTTLAHDFTIKLLGDTKYNGYSSEQFFWGWLLFPSTWENENIFEVPLSKRQEFLQLKPTSNYSDFFTDKGVYKLNHYIRNTEAKTEPTLLKELNKLNEKIQLVAMLRSGAMIKIFPYRDEDGNITWYSPVDELPSEMDKGQALFIKNSFDMILSAYANSNITDFELIASKIASYQQKYGGESLITPKKVRAEQRYYSFSIITILYRLNLLLGILAIITLIIKGKNHKIEQSTLGILRFSMACTSLFLTIHIALKWYIIGRVPLINGYDTMIFMGWASSILTLVISRHSSLLTAMGTIMVGFTTLVATIGGMSPQITPLMPVLNSPFLTTHVCFIMLSYTLFAFTFINGIIAICKTKTDKELLKRITLFSKIFLILGITFLSIGIFIGAIWANVSWGRYWAWDPKEVWALITMMIYALPLHSKSIQLFTKPKIFHIYLIIAFLSLLMTYFGVNYILGGMHAYVS